MNIYLYVSSWSKHQHLPEDIRDFFSSNMRQDVRIFCSVWNIISLSEIIRQPDGHRILYEHKGQKYRWNFFTWMCGKWLIFEKRTFKCTLQCVEFYSSLLLLKYFSISNHVPWNTKSTGTVYCSQLSSVVDYLRPQKWKNWKYSLSYRSKNSCLNFKFNTKTVRHFSAKPND